MLLYLTKKSPIGSKTTKIQRKTNFVEHFWGGIKMLVTAIVHLERTRVKKQLGKIVLKVFEGGEGETFFI